VQCAATAKKVTDTQICQRLKDALDSVNNRERWRKLSELYWTAIKKMGDIPSTGKGKKFIFHSASVESISVNNRIYVQ
jgi:hypothetical protein